jgi:hypothetical protein
MDNAKEACRRFVLRVNSNTVQHNDIQFISAAKFLDYRVGVFFPRVQGDVRIN